jgi:hypothetical protein
LAKESLPRINLAEELINRIRLLFAESMVNPPIELKMFDLFNGFKFNLKTGQWRSDINRGRPILIMKILRLLRTSLYLISNSNNQELKSELDEWLKDQPVDETAIMHGTLLFILSY